MIIRGFVIFFFFPPSTVYSTLKMGLALSGELSTVLSLSFLKNILLYKMVNWSFPQDRVLMLLEGHPGMSRSNRGVHQGRFPRPGGSRKRPGQCWTHSTSPRGGETFRPVPGRRRGLWSRAGSGLVLGRLLPGPSV